MAGPPPVIEGSLKNTIHALAFGLIVATLVVNFGKFFLPHFFPYMMGVVIFFEAVLFSLDKPKEKYDVFQPAGLKGQHMVDGSNSPQIMVSGPGEDAEFSPRKQRVKDKQKARKDHKGRRESGIPGSPSRSAPRHSLSVPPITGMQTADGAGEKGKEKSEKEKKKEEEKEKKKEKEEEKERQKAEKKEEKEKGKEGDEDKSEKGSWRKRLGKKQNSE